MLHSTEHLPPQWVERFGASMDWSWSFVLGRLPGDRSRFAFRSLVHLEPPWVEAFYVGPIIPADFVMGRQMLRGVRQRTESTTAADPTALARDRRGPC